MCQGDCTYFVQWRTILIAFAKVTAFVVLDYVWNERRPLVAVPSADSRESRSLCGSRGGTKTFPLEELWVPVDKEGSVVSMDCLYACVQWGSM